MIDDQPVLAVVPARGGSVGLPGKNLVDVNGVPMVAWPIRAGLGSRYVDTVVVSTDDAGIAAVAREHGAEVPFTRPAIHATATATSSQVVLHALDFFRAQGRKFGYVVLLQPTCPLTDAHDVDTAMESLHGNRAAADTIVGVHRVESPHPDHALELEPNGLLRTHFADSFAALGRRQDTTELYYPEGTVYISDVAVLRAEGTFYHDRTMGYLVPKWKALDVDDLVDLICVRAVMQNIDLLVSDRAGTGGGE